MVNIPPRMSKEINYPCNGIRRKPYRLDMLEDVISALFQLGIRRYLIYLGG